MTRVFLCGPLAHAPLAEIVLGAPISGQDAVLEGYGLCALQGGEQAGLAPMAGTVSGLCVDLDDKTLARLRYYLLVYGIDLAEGPLGLLPVADGDEPWNDLKWNDSFALQVIASAQEIMSHWHTYSAPDMARRLGPIRMRAQYWAKAQGEAADPDHDPDADVIVHAVHRPYLNYFAAQEMDLQFRKYDGTMSPVINRGALMMGEATVVLPYDPVQDAVLLVEQFRAPLFMGGSRRPWSWEAVAGMIDPGETPQETAHREAMEEAGVTFTALHDAGAVHSSAGTLSDRLHLFVGIADLSTRRAATGVESEGEDIRSAVFAYDTFMERLDTGGFNNLPLVALALWLARHKHRMT